MTISKLLRAYLTTGLLIAGGSSLAAPEVVVIASSSSPISTASPADIARLFLGKTKSVNGQTLTPVDQSKSSDVASRFYSDVVGKNSSQMRAYWSKLVFTGKGKPPQELGSSAAVLAAVAADPALIGYIEASAVNDSVKVLMTVK
ncbi:MAG: hypothetical protein WBN34_06880 [Woeseia sp.]